MKNLARAGVAAALAAASIATANAAVTDATGDVVGSFTGTFTPSLDIVSANVQYLADTNRFFVTATLNGPALNAGTGASFIWGINRGEGTARFAAGGFTNILFDSTIQLTLGGTFNVNRLIEASLLTNIDPGLNGVSPFDGNTISGFINASLLPSRGFAFDQYQWNFWPRVATPTGLPGIPDFAPNNAMQLVETPEPGSMGLLALGLSLTLIAAHRSRRRKQ
jgi:hypothetical protein